MKLRGMGTNSRRALLGVFVLAGVAVVGAVIGFGTGGGGIPAMPTTGAYAPITVAKPLITKPGLNGALKLDPDSMIRQGQDLQTVLLRESDANRYLLTVTNTSGLGYINSFDWYPPNGVSIVKVVGSDIGQCELTGTSGLGGKLFQGVVSNPKITCVGVNLKPPSCTCKGDGGHVEITFVTDRQIGLDGAVRVVSATPILNIIPSSVTSPETPDEQICAPGQVSTKSSPCVAH